MAIVKKVSSSEQIINYILDQISQKKLKPGDRLMNERAFSEELGVSRVPLREAISALSMVGILEARQGDGTFVKHYDARMLAKVMHIYSVLDDISMRELFEVRAMIEVQTLNAAIRCATEEEIARVGRELEHFDNYSRDMGDLYGRKEEGLKTYVALNRFHGAIAEVTHNRFLKQFMDSIWYMAEEYHILAIEHQSNISDCLRNAQEEHRAIYGALKDRDVERGRMLMYHHLMDECDAILEATGGEPTAGATPLSGEPAVS